MTGPGKKECMGILRLSLAAANLTTVIVTEMYITLYNLIMTNVQL